MAPPALLYALSTEPKLVGGNHGRSRSVAVCAEQAAQIGHDCSRVVMQLPPGDPDDPPPGGLKDPIAGAVALEGSSRSVKRVSVQLGDHPLGQPHTVPFDPPAPYADAPVDVWTRQAGLVEQGKETVLQLAARDR